MRNFAVKQNLVVALLALGILGAFALDSLAPPGIADGIGYALILMLCLWLPNPRAALYAAALCTILTVVSQFLAPPGGIGEYAWINRGIAIATIWVVASLLYKRGGLATALIRAGRAEQALHVSEERLGQAVRVAEIGIFDHDQRADALYWSPQFREIYGWTADEQVTLEKYMEVIHPDDRERVAEAIRNAHDPKIDIPFDLEKRIIRRDGAVRWMKTRTHTFFEGEGDERRAVRTVGATQDITEAKHAAASLAFANNLLKTQIANSPDGILVVDKYRKVILFNKRFGELWKIPENVVAAGVDDAILRAGIEQVKDPEKFYDRVTYLYDHPEEIGTEDIEFKDGRVFERHSAVLRDPEEKYLGRVWIFHDITKRKQAEQALQDSEERLGQAVRVSGIGIFDHDQVKDVIYWSPQLRKIYGWNATEEVTLPKYFETIYPEDRERIVTAVKNAHDPKIDVSFDVEHRIIRRDGAIRWLAMKAHTFFQGEGEARRPVRTVGATKDVTEMREAEDAIKHQLRLLATIMDNAVEAIFLCAAGARVTFMNKAAERMFGWRQEELLGKVLHDAIHYKHPDGRPYPLEECPFFQVFSSLETLTNREDKWIRKDGTFIDVNISNAPIIQDGKATGFVLVMDDITERKRAEEALQNSEAQLRQAQKMEAIGQLTGGIAHDFNNLLSIVIGNLELILDRANTEPNLKKLAQAALDGSLRGAELTQRLLAYSRKQSLQPKATDLAERLANMSPLLHRTLGEQTTVEIVPESGLWPVLIDPFQLDDSILNLALNARDAMPKGGTLTIKASNVRLDADAATGLAAGDYVLLTVGDTGRGMAPEVLDRVFEPFYTTKETGKGSGLGLSMVYGFVKQSNGHIKICSEVGGGTTVKIYLPRAAAAAAPASPPRLVGSSPAVANELILVVEDNDAVREVVRRQLTDMGYRTLEAATAESALALIDQNPDIDLVLSDVLMRGGIDGYDLAHQARKRRPDLKILLMSGFTMKSIAESFPGAEEFEMLKKPFRKDDLAEKLRRLLAPSVRGSAA